VVSDITARMRAQPLDALAVIRLLWRHFSIRTSTV